VNADCFAHKDGICLALEENICRNRSCPFYKTVEERKEQEKKTAKRIKELYGLTPQNFIKGRKNNVK